MTPAYPVMRLGKALYNVVIALTGAYGLSVLGYLLLRGLVGESWWIIAVMNSFAHVLLLPALILVPLLVLLRQFRLIVLLLPALAAFIVTYGPFFAPRVTAAPPGAALEFSVLTYNIAPQLVNLGPLTANIWQADADIVAIQELSDAAAAHLEAELGELYPYMALHSQPGQPIPGQGILSRYPITSDDYWQVNLGHQRVTLAMDGQTVTVYNVHPIHPFVSRDGFDRRALEIDIVLERAAQDSGPVLLVGDFNMSDQSADYGRVSARYTDVYRTVGWGMGFTFPDLKARNAQMPIIGLIPDMLLPIARIDYVFHDTAFTSLEARVLPESGGSDHRPLYALLSLN